MLTFKTYTAADGERLFESVASGTIFRTEDDAREDEIKRAVNVLVVTPPAAIRAAAADPASADPKLIDAAATLNEYFSQAAAATG